MITQIAARKCMYIIAAILAVVNSNSQNQSTTSPSFLERSYFGLSTCYINYPFSNLQVPPGNEAQTVTVPHTGFRFTFLGYSFSPAIAAEIALMRPIYWVGYNNVKSDHSNHTVWVTEGSVSLKSHVSLIGQLAIDAECGLGVISRHGFKVNNVPVIADANYPTVILGAALNYRLSDNFDVLAGLNVSPKSASENQPTTSAISVGFHYRVDTAVTRHGDVIARSSDAIPEHMIQLGITPNHMSYSTNKFFSEGKVPVFFRGGVEVANGFTAAFESNLFRSTGVFSLDGGTNVSYWKSSRNGTKFVGFSLFPVMKFAILRNSLFQLYFNYSAAGPSMITKTLLDGHDVGKHFTFQDYMSMSANVGRAKKFNVEVRIAHYSNGNIFPQNAGIDMPLTFLTGYTF